MPKPRLTVAIVDDEPLAVRRLCRAIEQIEDAEVVATSSRASEAVELIDRTSPDVLLIDIAMPRVSGLEVVDRIRRNRTAVVFVTAHHEHAAHAFEIDAADYLLKPVAQDRLESAIQRSRRWLESQSRNDPPGDETADDQPRFFWAYTNREFVRIAVDAIEWIEAQGNYVWIHAGSTGGMIRTTIQAICDRLDAGAFIRIHRSVVCRIDAIAAMSRRSSGALQARLRSGAQVPVGRTYAAELAKRLAPPA